MEYFLTVIHGRKIVFTSKANLIILLAFGIGEENYEKLHFESLREK